MFKMGCWFWPGLLWVWFTPIFIAPAAAQATSTSSSIPVLNNPEPFTKEQLLRIWEQGFSTPGLYFDGRTPIKHDFCLSNQKITEEATGNTLARLKLFEIAKEPVLTDGSGLIPYLYVLEAVFPSTKNNTFFDDWYKNNICKTYFIGVMLFLDPNSLFNGTTGNYYKDGDLIGQIDLYIYPDIAAFQMNTTALNERPLDISHYYLAFPKKISDC